MSVDSVGEQGDVRQWENTDEIDLTRYITALTRRWLEILLVTLTVMAITAAGVLIYRAIVPPLYEATATAAIVRATSIVRASTDVSFDERYTTSSEQQNFDISSRRTALIALINNGAIAQQVIAEMGDALPPELREPAELLEAVKGEMATVDGGWQSDLISITARSQSPETSAAIANAWMKAYVQHVNTVYGQAPDEVLSSVATELAAAQQTYAEAQARLESHLSNSRLNELVRQSDTLSRTLRILQATQVDAITGENDRIRSQLRMYNDQWLRTNSLLAAARTLGEQMSGEAVETASIAVALQVLQVQLVNATAVSPPEPNVNGDEKTTVINQQPSTTLQLQLDNAAAVSPLTLRSQISATVESLETQLALLETSIQQATQALASGTQQAMDGLLAAANGAPVEPSSATAGAGTLAEMIAQLEQQLRTLEGQIEVETARTLEFTEQRDLARDSMQALSNKEADLQLTRAAASSEIRLSSTAVPLDKEVDQVSLAISLILAGLAGLLLGVLVALGLELANVPPLRSQTHS